MGDKYLVSGCVSALIYLWDPITGQPIYYFKNTQGVPSAEEEALNTINCLNFSRTTEDLFLAGARDGIAKLYDIRCDPKTHGSVMTFRAHNNKLNQIVFNHNDRLMLSSGRDNSVRLWDVRMIQSSIKAFDQHDEYHKIPPFLMEYKGHKCQGYNIAASFFGYEDFILTGSEDSAIYIYNKNTGCVERKIPTKSKVVHLVKPVPFGN